VDTEAVSEDEDETVGEKKEKKVVPE